MLVDVHVLGVDHLVRRALLPTGTGRSGRTRPPCRPRAATLLLLAVHRLGQLVGGLGEPLRRPLNVARPLFSKRGLAAFHATSPAQRVERLTELSAPSYPEGRAWDEPLAAAAREGRFRVAERVDGAEQVICATGFRRGPCQAG